MGPVDTRTSPIPTILFFFKLSCYDIFPWKHLSSNRAQEITRTIEEDLTTQSWMRSHKCIYLWGENQLQAKNILKDYLKRFICNSYSNAHKFGQINQDNSLSRKKVFLEYAWVNMAITNTHAIKRVNHKELNT